MEEQVERRNSLLERVAKSALISGYNVRSTKPKSNLLCFHGPRNVSCQFSKFKKMLNICSQSETKLAINLVLGATLLPCIYLVYYALHIKGNARAATHSLILLAALMLFTVALNMVLASVERNTSTDRKNITEGSSARKENKRSKAKTGKKKRHKR